MAGEKYRAFHARSLAERDAFWSEQAKLVDWHKPLRAGPRLLPPAVREVVRRRRDQPVPQRGGPAPRGARRPDGARLDLDRDRPGAALHLPGAARGGEPLRRDDAVARRGRGDRVLIYMPMIPEAVFAMLACARIGAIHSVVFGGFAAAQPRRAHRRRAAEADGHRGRRHARRARRSSTSRCSTRRSRSPNPAARKCSSCNRGLDHDCNARRRSRPRLRGAAREAPGREGAGAWLESNEPSYILYTSGTTGQPKGVQRDTGGYAVALAASMKHIYCGDAGRDDVHHLRHRLGGGPLVHRLRAADRRHDDDHVRGRADPSRRRRSGGRSCRTTRSSVMFSSPTAIRVLKKQDPAFLTKYDLSQPAAICSSPASRSTSPRTSGSPRRSASR